MSATPKLWQLTQASHRGHPECKAQHRIERISGGGDPNEAAFRGYRCVDHSCAGDRSRPACTIRESPGDGCAICYARERASSSASGGPCERIARSTFIRGGISRIGSALPKYFEVPSGTRLPLVLHNAISTRSAQPGDPVYLETLFPIVIDSRILIPAGSYVSGEVTEAKRPGRVHGRGEIKIKLDNLILPNGYQASFNASPTGAGSGGTSQSAKKARSKAIRTRPETQAPSWKQPLRARASAGSSARAPEARELARVPVQQRVFLRYFLRAARKRNCRVAPLWMLS